jgi:DNA-directed RNA polymerase subunit F
MPNVERVEAIKQILNPDYFAQLKMILWAIKGNGEDLRAELLNLIPFTMDEVKDIFSKSKFKGITQSYSTLAGMINVCVAKKEK